MTVQRQRPRGVPRPRPVGERRRSVVYGIPTLPVDKRTGKVIPGAPPVVGYIGKSVQTVWQRQEQHRADQPFSDLICGGSWVIEEGYWTADELAAREEWWIRNGVALVSGQKPQRPVYNYDWNLDNPHRIEKWRAIEHRQLREPGWQPGHGRVDVRRAAGTDWTGRIWWLVRKPITWWAVIALTFIGWVAHLPRAAWWDGAVYVACIACTVRGLRMPSNRRRRTRRRRRA